MKAGKSGSCGCLQRELVSKRAATHGHTKGGGFSPEYYSWAGMMTNCTNPNRSTYKGFAERGITVCERWSSFEHFLADMGEKPSKVHRLARNDPSAGFDPSNCTWRVRTVKPRIDRQKIRAAKRAERSEYVASVAMAHDLSCIDDAELASLREKLTHKRRVDDRGCWLWTGGTNSSGYGVTPVYGARGWVERVHRLSIWLFGGVSPGSLCVLHKCDVPACFNPDHLFVGTHKNNTDDMVRKGRCGQTKLTDVDVSMIRERRLAGERSADVARAYGVSQCTVQRVMSGQRKEHAA